MPSPWFMSSGNIFKTSIILNKHFSTGPSFLGMTGKLCIGTLLCIYKLMK